jgi:hypothetical protein
MTNLARTAEHRAAVHAAYFEQYLRDNSLTRTTMTGATEAIWGTSGRGNPNAVRQIEATAALGYLRIENAGKRKRIVSRTEKPIPAECFAYAGIEAPLGY